MGRIRHHAINPAVKAELIKIRDDNPELVAAISWAATCRDYSVKSLISALHEGRDQNKIVKAFNLHEDYVVDCVIKKEEV